MPVISSVPAMKVGIPVVPSNLATYFMIELLPSVATISLETDPSSPTTVSNLALSITSILLRFQI